MRYIKNLFFLLISHFSTLLLNFFILKILTNFLHPEKLGVYFTYLGGSLILSQVMLLGFPYVFTRFIPYWEEKKQEKKIFPLLLFFLLIYTLLVFLSLIILVFLPFFNRNLIFLSLTTAYLFSLLTIFVSLYTAFRKMQYSFLINFIYLTLFFLIVYLMKDSISVKALFSYQILSLTTGILGGIVFLAKKLRFEVLNLKEIFREIKIYWKESFLLHILSPIFDYADRLLLAIFSNFINVSLFTSMRKIIQPLRQILHYPAEAMAPEISAKADRFKEFKVSFELLRKMLFIFSIHLFFIIFILGRFFISLITSEFYLSAYPVLIILGFKIIVSSLYSPYLLLYRSYGRMIHFFYSDLLWVVFFVCFAYPSVKYLGIEGLALLHLFASIVTLFFNFFFIIPLYKVVSRKEFLQIFKYSLSSLIPFLTLFLLKIISPFLILIVFYIVFMILSFIFKPFTREEIVYIKKVLKK